MKHLVLFVVSFLLVLSQPGSASAQYGRFLPPVAAVSGMKEKKELKICASVKVKTNELKTDPFWSYPIVEDAHVHLAAQYALLDHFFVGASYSSPTQGGTATGSSYEHSGMLEISAGYFIPLTKHLRFEVQAGYTWGRYHFEHVERWYDSLPLYGPYKYHEDKYPYQLSFNRYFVQPVFTIGGDYFSASVGARVSLQKYRKFSSEGYPAMYYYGKREQEIDDYIATPYTLLQPFVNLEAGGRYLAFNTQIGVSYESVNTYAYLSTGLVFHLAPRFRKEKSK